jgi:hypothetical protein
MHKRILVSVVLFSALVVSGCGGVVEPEPSSLASQGQALQQIGQGCDYDTQCASGLCWRTDDSYPLYNPSWEQGSSCTLECDEGDNAFCQQLAAQYNAPRPNSARCIFARAVYDEEGDGSYYVCDLVAAGLGSYWSE